MFDVFRVYLIDFKQNIGGEISGKHYAVIMSKMSKKDDTLIVAPITSKKKGKKYRGGITIDCTKYQKNLVKFITLLSLILLIILFECHHINAYIHQKDEKILDSCQRCKLLVKSFKEVCVIVFHVIHIEN